MGCSARLEISFELNLLLRVNKVTLHYFTLLLLNNIWPLWYIVWQCSCSLQNIGQCLICFLTNNVNVICLQLPYMRVIILKCVSIILYQMSHCCTFTTLLQNQLKSGDKMKWYVGVNSASVSVIGGGWCSTCRRLLYMWHISHT